MTCSRYVRSARYGLAAVQIGVPRRVITIDLAKKDSRGPQVINPEVIWASDEKATYEEAVCLF
jgi:peptide deformylase